MTGWRKIGADPRLSAWAKAALGPAKSALAASGLPLRAGGTWAVGLDLLDNDSAGGIGGEPLPWDVLGLAPTPLHKGQISAVYPDYPRREAGQTEAGFRFLRDRDGAHLDGLLPIGAEKRRYLREPHAFILGIALTRTASAPLVVWQGSHRIIQNAFENVDILGDLTDIYARARSEVFATCARVEISLEQGEAVILDRKLIHGVAPWKGGDAARLIAYFRPLCQTVADWMLPEH